VIAVPIGLLLPWAWFSEAGSRPDGLVIGGVFLVGPLLSLLAMMLRRFDPAHRRPAEVAGGVGAAIALALAAATAATVDALHGIAPGGPVTVLAAACGALGWALLAAGGPSRGGDTAPRPVALAAGFVVLVAAVGVAAGHWYADDRFVHRSFASGPPKGSAGAWRLAADMRTAALAGRLLVVGQPSGVLVTDALTGRKRWSYRRSDLPAQAVALTGDGRSVVVLYAAAGGVLVVALDMSTGRTRWLKRHPTTVDTIWRVDRMVLAGDLVIAGGTGVDPGDIVALDVRTGDVRWTWRPEPAGGRCAILDLAGAGTTVGVAARCPRGGVLRDAAIGLSTVDGTVRWNWEPTYPAGVVRGDEPAIAAAGDGFLVRYGQFPAANVKAPRTAVVLDATTGSTRASHPAPERIASVVGNTVLYLASDARAVDLSTGATRWTRRVGQATGGGPVAISAASGTDVYVLMRAANPDGVTAGDAGDLRLLALDAGSGDLLSDHAYSLTEATCTTGGDGQRRCDRRQAGLLVTAGTVVLYEQPVRTAPATVFSPI
jgi:outer membrane protein assembly factor BamB